MKINDTGPTSLDESVRETLKRDLHTIYTKLKYFYSFSKGGPPTGTCLFPGSNLKTRTRSRTN